MLFQFIRRSIRQKLIAFVVSLALTLGFPLISSVNMLAGALWMMVVKT